MSGPDPNAKTPDKTSDKTADITPKKQGTGGAPQVADKAGPGLTNVQKFIHTASPRYPLQADLVANEIRRHLSEKDAIMAFLLQADPKIVEAFLIGGGSIARRLQLARGLTP